MAALAGKGGKVMSGASTVAFVESWEICVEDEALETTGLGANSKSYIGRGLPGTTANITWRAVDQSDTGTLTFLTAAQPNATGLRCSCTSQDRGINLRRHLRPRNLVHHRGDCGRTRYRVRLSSCLVL